MLTAITTNIETGEQELLIGLSYGNLRKFKEQPLETQVLVTKERTTLPMNIRIISGPTEESIKEFMLQHTVKKQ